MDNGDFQYSASPVDMVLSYVSRVLMEEDDAEEELLCRDIDHPALLQVQEPFARILFPPSSTSLNSDSTINKSNMNYLLKWKPE
jgi:hypothetical protein